MSFNPDRSKQSIGSKSIIYMGVSLHLKLQKFHAWQKFFERLTSFPSKSELLLSLIKNHVGANRRLCNMVLTLTSTKPRKAKEYFYPVILLAYYLVWINEKGGRSCMGVSGGGWTSSTAELITINDYKWSRIIIQYMKMNMKEAGVCVCVSGGEGGGCIKKDQKKSLVFMTY